MRQFRIDSSEDQLTDLSDQLARTRFAPALSGQDWTHGTPPGYLAELVDHWRTPFHWRAAEDELNRLRGSVADTLAADDLAALDRLLDPDGPHNILRRADLAVRAERTVWAAA